MERNTKVFPCPQCPVLSTTFRSLLRHIQCYHSQQSNWSMTCGISGCSKTYRLFSSFKKHLYREHRECVCDSQTAFPPEVTDASNNTADIPPPAACDGPESVEDQRHEEESSQQITRQLALLFLKLKEKNGLPESTVNGLAEEIFSLLELNHENLSHAIVEHLTRQGYDVSSDQHLQNILSDTHLKSVFNMLNSSKQRENYCRDSLSHVPPVQVNLSAKDSYQYISILDVLKKILQDEGVWEDINRCRPPNGDVLTDFCDGELCWQSEDGQLHLQILLYLDEFEVCNPLGAQRGIHKIMGVYWTLLNLSPKFRSSLANINAVILVKNLHIETYGLTKILEPLVKDVNRLSEHGIIIRNVCLKGHIHAVVSDNLASHKIGGFQQSFAAGRICRFCMAAREQINNQLDESNFVIRTTGVHKYHLSAIENNKDLMSVYGVKGTSALDGLLHFDATKSLPPDVMHDVLEGVIPVTLKHVLRHCIKSKYFTLDELNIIITEFEYGRMDRDSKPPNVTHQSVMGDSLLKGSASQKWCFFRLLTLFVGSAVPEDDDAWQVYLDLRKLVYIVLAPILPRNQIPYLAVLIRDFLVTFRRVFPDKACTPKMHYLIHYPRLMFLYGPLVRYWAMRFEAKHQYFKQLARKLHNFKNICHTLATRHQFLQSYQLSGPMLERPDEVCGGSAILQANLSPPVLGILEDNGLLSSEDNVYQMTSLLCNGVRYRVGELLIQSVDEEDIPSFMIIKQILVTGNRKVICGKTMKVLYFDSHHHAYIVQAMDNWKLVDPGNEIWHAGLHIYEKNERLLVPLKYGVWA